MGLNTVGVMQQYALVPVGPNAGKPSYEDVIVPANTLIGNNTGSPANPIFLSIAQILSMLSLSGQKFAQSFGNGVATSFVIPHGLTGSDFIAQIRKTSNDEVVGGNVKIDSTNVTITITGSPPALNELRVVVLG